MALKFKQIQEFKETKIGDVCPFVYGKGLSEKERNTGKIPVYGSNGIVGWHDKSFLNGPCIIIGRKGSIGKIHHSQIPCWPIDTTFYIEENQNYHLKFIFYLLKFVNLENMDSDTSVPGLNRNAVHEVKISIPEKTGQMRISQVLENLDTKIENLQTQNKILEQTAQAIFKSWFVNFDGQTEFEDSELGQIPKGWSVDTIFSHCEQVNYGYTQSSSTEPVGPKFLRITDIVKDVISWSDVPFCEIDPKHFEKYQLHDGDIVIARTGASTGDNKLITIPPKSVFASYLIRLRLKSRFMSEYIALFLQSITYKNYIHSILGEKSAQPNANAKTLTNCKITTPEKEILKKFAVISQSVHQHIEKNNHSISQLEQTRDALLPKLMSGEIRV